jgi:hypothetical protein
MLKKMTPLLLLLFLFLSGAAQNASDKTDSAMADSVLPVLRAQDGKIVTIGQPVSSKPMSTMDKVTLFIKTAYAKYPVWCWIWAIIIVLTIGRFFTRLFSK